MIYYKLTLFYDRNGAKQEVMPSHLMSVLRKHNIYVGKLKS